MTEERKENPSNEEKDLKTVTPEAEEKREETIEVSVSETQGKKQEKSNRLSFFVGGLLLAILLIFGFSCFAAQKSLEKGNESALTSSFSSFLKVAELNGKSVSYKDYAFLYDTINHYVKVAEPNTDEQAVKDRAALILLINEFTSQLADKHDISLSRGDIKEAKEDFLQQYEGDEKKADEDMKEKYNLSFDKYFNKIFLSMILERKLSEELTTGEYEGMEDFKTDMEQARARHILFKTVEGEDENVVREKAEEVLERAKDGEDFAELAKEFSADGSASSGGDLGWFGKGMMVPPFEEVAFSAEVGKVHEELVKTDFGFHIIFVEKRGLANDVQSFINKQMSEVEVEILYPEITDPFIEIKAMLQAM